MNEKKPSSIAGRLHDCSNVSIRNNRGFLAEIEGGSNIEVSHNIVNHDAGVLKAKDVENVWVHSNTQRAPNPLEALVQEVGPHFHTMSGADQEAFNQAIEALRSGDQAGSVTATGWLRDIASNAAGSAIAAAIARFLGL